MPYVSVCVAIIVYPFPAISEHVFVHCLRFVYAFLWIPHAFHMHFSSMNFHTCLAHSHAFRKDSMCISCPCSMHFYALPTHFLRISMQFVLKFQEQLYVTVAFPITYRCISYNLCCNSSPSPCISDALRYAFVCILMHFLCESYAVPVEILCLVSVLCIDSALVLH